MKNKKILTLVFTFAIMLCINFVSAATISSAGTATVGDKIPITVNFGYAVGSYKDIKVTYNGGTIASEGLWVIDESTKQGISSKSYTFTPSAPGTYNINFTANAVVGMDDTKKGTVTATKTIVVKEKEAPPPPVTKPEEDNNISEKSSNAYLKTLQVNQEGLAPDFNKSKYSYSLAVDKAVNNINITAIAESKKARVAISGNNDLKDGDNTIKIVVTAENGSKKTYTIIVTRSENVDNSNAYLENIIVENTKLTPNFEAEVFEYNCEKVASDINKLELKVFPKIEGANVTITGNDQLIDGENIIKIIVTAKDGTTTKEYIIKVVKEATVAVDSANTTTPPTEKQNLADTKGIMATANRWYNTVIEAICNYPLIFILYAFVLVEFIQILYLFNKFNKLKKQVNGVIKNKEEKTIDQKLVERNSPRSGAINDIENKELDNITTASVVNNYDETLKNNIKKQDEPVTVKSVEFNTTYDPSIFTKKSDPKESMNSYDDYMRTKRDELEYEKNNENKIDGLDDVKKINNIKDIEDEDNLDI